MYDNLNYPGENPTSPFDYGQTVIQSGIMDQYSPSVSYCDSRRNDFGNSNKIVSVKTHYFYDPVTNTMNCEVKKGNGKSLITPLTSGFKIGDIDDVSEIGSREIKNVIIEYFTDRKYKAFIPIDDYYNDKFHPYMEGVHRLPGCTKSQFNALCSHMVKSFPHNRIEIYPRQGFIKISTDSVAFGAYLNTSDVVSELLPDSVKMRPIFPPYRNHIGVITRWSNIFRSNNNLKQIALSAVGSLLGFILYDESVIPEQLLVISPSSDIDEEKLEAMLCFNDTKVYPIPPLEINEKKMLTYLIQIYDGMAVFKDHSFADDSLKVEESMKRIIKVLRRDYGEQSVGRNIIAIISENAAYVANRIAPEKVISLSMEGIQLGFDSEYIHTSTKEMEALVIGTIIDRLNEVRVLISSVVQAAKSNRSKFQNSETYTTAIILRSAEEFLRCFYNISLISDAEFKKIIQCMNEMKNSVIDTDTAIKRDFAKVISEYFRSGKFKSVPKRNGMTLDPNRKIAVISGNRLFLGTDMIDEVLESMRTTHNKRGLIGALDHTGVINTTDGFTHPIELHDINGEHARLYMYDVYAEILDADVLYRLRNPDIDAFMLSPNEQPGNNFMSLINDSHGRTAGKQICYTEEDNEHCYTTGQSGFGKTYTQCQLMAKRHELGHRVMVFDSSDSFTYEALCRNLSKEFVDENVLFIDLDNDGIPIHLFKVDRSLGKPSQKKQLVGILTSAIGELSVLQSNVLRSTLSKLLSASDMDKISTENIVSELQKFGRDNEEKTFESLLTRLEPLFEDIAECGMSDNSWDDILESTDKIIVIHTDSMVTENGNQIIDMMLSTLFNYQHTNFTIPLDIFIDEIQNQNFSEGSPIRKIMKEGRKLHMAFFGSTQDFYRSNTEIGSVMGKAGTQIFLRPTQDSEKNVAAELRFKKADMDRFDSMYRGDVIIKGSFFMGHNIQSTLSGRIDDYLPDSEDEDIGKDGRDDD